MSELKPRPPKEQENTNSFAAIEKRPSTYAGLKTGATLLKRRGGCAAEHRC